MNFSFYQIGKSPFMVLKGLGYSLSILPHLDCAIYEGAILVAPTHHLHPPLCPLTGGAS